MSSSSSAAKSVIRERMKKRAAGMATTNTSSSSTQRPCEHPAVVGGLCAVCGADTRAADELSQTKPSSTSGEWLSTRRNSAAAAADLPSKPIPKEPLLHVPRKVPRKENTDIRQQQILEKQKNIANSLASAAHLDEEMAAIDMKSLTIPKKAAAPVLKSVIKKPVTSTGSRSLSSLLSGAMATQKMQQTHGTTGSSINNNLRSVQRQNKFAPHNSTNQSSFNSSDPKMTQMTVSGGVTLTVSESEAKAISAASAKKLTEEKKLCLVLDLDHTLLHATDDYRASRFVADEIIVSDTDDETKIDEHALPKTIKNDLKRDDVRTILLPMELPPEQQHQYVQQKLQQQGQQSIKLFEMEPLPLQNKNNNSVIIMRHYIKLRPYLKEFFTQIQSTYQLSVYTAGTRAYAEQVAIMICRHLVGASLDEEGVNKLRGKLREKDEECRRYQAYVARQKQLELAKERNAAVDSDEAKSKGARKAVKFDHSNEEDEARKATIDLIVIDDSDDDTYDGERASSGKRSADSMNVDVPRKKKKSVNFGSMPSPDPPPSTEASDVAKDDSKLKLTDPTEERDRLRIQLEDAEKLEIKAVELRRKMFGSRIVSRTDVGDLGKDVKSLKRVFPCGGVMAAILDDREDVWANAKNNVTGRPGEPPDNLLLVKPYHWKPFQGYADVNNASGQDLSESDDTKQDDKSDAKDDDQMLLWTADILRRLHERYYSTSTSVEKSVPDLLRSMRRETLRRHPSAKVVLSGLIPIHEQNKQSHVRPPIVRYAEELGAEVLPDVVQGVTHVVAARDGSSKIHRARKEYPGCYVVHTAWLMECYWSITRRDERIHHMGPLPKQLTNTLPPAALSLTATTKKNILLLGSDKEESDVDEMEDDFAAALENDMMDS
jgi:RNA polymerase II subunit A-like phosphatase